MKIWNRQENSKPLNPSPINLFDARIGGWHDFLFPIGYEIYEKMSTPFHRLSDGAPPIGYNVKND